MPNIDTNVAGSVISVVLTPMPAVQDGAKTIQLELVQGSVSQLAATALVDKADPTRMERGLHHKERGIEEHHHHHVPMAAGAVGMHHHVPMAADAVGMRSKGPHAGEVAESARAIDKYMGSKGLEKLDVGDLYKLATDESAPKDARKAAKFFLAHPKEYQKIETLDSAHADGISGRGNFHKAAAAGALAAVMPPKVEIALIKGLEGEVHAVSTLASPSHQSSLDAAEAVLKKMEDPNYMPTPAEFAAVMAYKNAADDKSSGNQVTGVSGGVASAAAAIAGGAGLASATAAAQAELQHIQAQMRQLNGAAGVGAPAMAAAAKEIALIKGLEGEVHAVSTLASPSHQSSLDAAEAVLKKMEDPNYMPTPAEFAAVMAYKTAPDDKSSSNQVTAVSGGVASAAAAIAGGAGLAAATGVAQAGMQAVQAQMSQGNVAGSGSVPTRGDVANAAGTLAQYQEDSHIDFMTSDDIYNLSRNALVPENVRNAAKFMVENPDVYHDIEVKAGQASDQKSSVNEMRDMATEMGSDVGSPYVPTTSSVAITAAPSAEGTAAAINTLGTYMSEKGMTELNANDLNAMLYSPDTSDDVKRAAKYMLQNSDVYESLTNASAEADAAVAAAPADEAAPAPAAETAPAPAPAPDNYDYLDGELDDDGLS